MSGGGGVNREQAKDMASLQAERQDRNAFLTDGGDWTWDASAGEITWAASAILRLGSAGSPVLMLATTISGISSAADCLYVAINRDTPAPVVPAAAAIIAAVVDEENVIVLGVRGSDDRFYMRDGTIFEDGETKRLGTVQGVLDRAEITSDGRLNPNTYTVTFNYDFGSDQLAVYVGGILQIESTAYDEIDDGGGIGTTIRFAAGYEPANLETITFINLVGGQGPAGTAGVTTLQEAYDGDEVIDTSTQAGGLLLQDAAPANPVLSIGSAGQPDEIEARASGLLAAAEERIRDAAGGNHPWTKRIAGNHLLFINETTEYCVRLDKDGGIELGTYSWPAGPFVADSKGGSGTRLRWAEFAGTFPASPAGPEIISTTLTDVKGAIAAFDNGATTFTQMLEMNLGASLNRSVYVAFDPAAQELIISRNSAGTLSVGANQYGEDYTLIVFY